MHRKRLAILFLLVSAMVPREVAAQFRARPLELQSLRTNPELVRGMWLEVTSGEQTGKGSLARVRGDTLYLDRYGLRFRYPMFPGVNVRYVSGREGAVPAMLVGAGLGAVGGTLLAPIPRAFMWILSGGRDWRDPNPTAPIVGAVLGAAAGYNLRPRVFSDVVITPRDAP